ncbi:type I-E CRISPR-associated protein Cas7/Cse4/CasC [Coraliomargarita algicola]|uniref:Type I-E CRISPR-associated protein Cas7/Cse4/CasC n=1 Tax=Coraliomargarita algicola TaxID=3092156 RepID=A0ABZ0RKI2_9BACT|nr:type I-E CRISPR-associated protein Cas7/Cse4/CasC [Coraliomargarita sp. J2-16]WPJ95661.1 type I-E CRISPR-associated protein Cas7/Cse4/CasC [Coraliomargarita sp. J2-16]
MKLIELHILQSFPVSCLNRDDVGSPKSAVFGGVPRARISSQCLKRASRVLAQTTWPEAKFTGIRTRFINERFIEALLAAGLPEKEAKDKAKELCEVYGTIDPKNEFKIKTPLFISPNEIETVANLIKEGKKPKAASQKASPSDSADICLFGRMIANDPTINVEGAGMFSHALSTHKTNNEVDFFSAVGDHRKDAEDAGADHIGSLEFNSATYYRYIAINLDLLEAPSHLGGLSSDERKAILRAFIQSSLTSVPNARKNSMNAGTLPHEVLGIRKDKGQPLQLINAFEEPVKNTGKGFASTSLEKMKEHLSSIEKVWGPQGDKHYLTQTEGGLDAFIDALLQD